jgi:hypothetical protein
MNDMESFEQTLRRLRKTAAENTAARRSRAPEVLAHAARLILDEPSPLASLAFAAGAKCGLTRPMVREGLCNLLGSVTVESLSDLQARGRTAPAGELIFHVLSGNLFLPGIESMLLASLRGAVSLVRPSAQDPLFPRLWWEAVRISDPAFARSLAVINWPHTDETRLEAACAAADIVVAYGSDTTIASLSCRIRPHQIFLGHGTRHSFAIVDASALSPDTIRDTARALAYDLSVYDQQGCLSPRAVFVAENGAVTPGDFARLLAEEMRLLARRLPRHELSLEESAALARERDTALLDAALGAERAVVSRPDDPFLITIGKRPAATLSAVNRHADVRPFRDAGEVAAALQPLTGSVSTLGIAGPMDSWRPLMASVGAARLCPAGQMQKPPLGCCHDGVTPLTEIAR